MGPMAVIDVGSNSVKLCVARVADGRLVDRHDRVRITRLAAGLVPGGRLQPEAAARTLAALTELAAEARARGAERILAAGTMALRLADDAPAFLAKVRRRTGLAIAILDGDEEARLAWRAAAAAGPGEGPLLVVDVGGASTEFIRGAGGRLGARRSEPVGVVSLTEAHLAVDPPRAADLAAVHAALTGALDFLPAFAAPRPAALVGVGGTATTLAAVAQGLEPYDPARVQGFGVSRAELARQIERYRTLTRDERRRLPGLMPERADVILAGALLLAAVLAILDLPELRVSDYGLRHALLLEAAG
ncbi:MAG: Ppx/GppA family phosphatase [Candidatus Krumholzibacteriota bacterium]|nr:Ppx/GppA family phosphatase [Candidatus Krumholzibacteriota bacterium]